MRSLSQGTDDLRQRLIEVDRRSGRDSLYYFSKKILGYGRMEKKPHADVCDFIQAVMDKHKRGLDLEPRGSFKTTQASQALPIWLLERDPNLRILLDSSVLQNSIDNLGVIKNHYMGNEKLRFLYGDDVGDHWVTEEITVKRRTRMDLKEPSIRCASLERVQVGPHYDVIIADDLVTDLNSRTPEARASVIAHIRLLFSLLEPNTGIILLEGTRWHYEDAYGWVLSELPEFATRICRARDEKKENLYFPQVLSNEFLDAVEKIQGRDIYNCQYNNDPAPQDENSSFARSMFKRYDKLPENRNTFMTIDPGGEKKGSDEWVFFGAHVDQENNKYFDRLVKGNWKASQCMDIFFVLASEMDPLAIGLETTGGQKWIHEMIIDQMRKRNKFFNIIPLPHAQDSKEYRIKRLQPQYQIGAVFHSREMSPLEDQLLRYPKGRDDIPDAASMVLEICYPPRKSKESNREPLTTDQFLLKKFKEGRDRRPAHSLLGDQW